MNRKMERVKKRIDDIKREREELRQKYEYLSEEMKKSIDKNSRDIELLRGELTGLGKKEEKEDVKVSDAQTQINSLQKSIIALQGKHAILKEKVNEEIGLAKDNLSSEISEDMKTIRIQLIDDIKKEVDMSLEAMKAAEKDIKRLSDRDDKLGQKLSDQQSSITSLRKAISTLEGKQSVFKEKIIEDMKSIGKDVNSRLLERIKSINANVKTQLNDGTEKNVRAVRWLEEKVNEIVRKVEEYENDLSSIGEDIGSVKKSVSELAEINSHARNEIVQRVNSLEKEINTELAKVKGFEERLEKDVEDFEKFAGSQRVRMEKFESKISNRVDMFAVEKENIKRDFTSISNDFKNIGHRLDSMRDKDSDLNQRLQNAEIEFENFKKITEEFLGKTSEEQTIFKENMVAKLNEASEKILNRLSQNEITTSSELAKQSEEVKLFRAHVTQFINDLVANYEKRFEMMKSDIDQTLRLLEERMQEQRAMIFE